MLHSTLRAMNPGNISSEEEKMGLIKWGLINYNIFVISYSTCKIKQDIFHKIIQMQNKLFYFLIYFFPNVFIFIYLWKLSQNQGPTDLTAKSLACRRFYQFVLLFYVLFCWRQISSWFDIPFDLAHWLLNQSFVCLHEQSTYRSQMLQKLIWV